MRPSALGVSVPRVEPEPMPGSVLLGRVAGIEIRVHPSWLIVIFLVSWSLATAYYPSSFPDLAVGTAWILGSVSALLLFASVLAHEMAHSLVALARGCRVGSITLFIFGGVASMEDEPQRPLREFVIAAVGPLTSFALAGLFAAAAAALEGVSGEATAVLIYLATINALLGLFNLIPGFPLDGGRVLRSIIWWITGSIRRATRIAAGTGRLVAYALISLGVIQIFGGNVLGGIWIAMIGWFLSSAADASVQQVTLADHLAGVIVGDVMRRDPVAAPIATSLRGLVDEYVIPFNLRAVPLTESRRLAGMITLADLRRVSQAQSPGTAIGSVLDGSPIVATSPGTSLLDALGAMAKADLERLPVVEDDRLVGILSRSDVVRYLNVREVVQRA